MIPSGVRDLAYSKTRVTCAQNYSILVTIIVTAIIIILSCLL